MMDREKLIFQLRNTKLDGGNPIRWVHLICEAAEMLERDAAEIQALREAINKMEDNMSSKIYMDSRGWRYRVMPGLGDNTFKGMYNKPDSEGWHCMRQMPWRDKAEAAEVDLAAYAETKGWKTVQE